MKRIFLIFLILTSEVHAVTREDNLTDQEIIKMMIGSWVISPDDPSYKEFGQISIYKENGDVIYKRYESHLCENISFQTFARWTIKDGHLVIIVRSSERPDLHPPDLVVVDKVYSISDKRKTLKSLNDGSFQYRIKSQTCVKSNEI